MDLVHILEYGEYGAERASELFAQSPCGKRIDALIADDFKPGCGNGFFGEEC